MNRIFVTDYDGTLAGNDGKINSVTIDALKKLGKLGVIRVIATGRSLFSLKTVVGADLPVDYLVFSSGIGIYDWKNDKLLLESSIGEEETNGIYDFLVNKSYDFMVQLPVPDNHFFHHFSSGEHNADFNSRISYYETHGVQPINKCPLKASQFVIICPEENGNFDLIKKRFNHLKVLRATSPIDNKSTWIEILPVDVSKAFGVEYIRKKYNAKIEDIIAVGNDYYDLDMLNYVNKERAFVVSNAPSELKESFNVIESNEQNGVANLINRFY